MNDAEQYLDDARKSFRLAANSLDAKAVKHYAEMGRDYLRLSHEAAQIVNSASHEAPHWWGLFGRRKMQGS